VCRPVNQLKPFPSIEQACQSVTDKVEEMVDSWALKNPLNKGNAAKMAYGTQTAILRRRGGTYKPANSEVVHDWVKSMYVLPDHSNRLEL
jgi:hypothetical protein